jgi:hypothetical protein
MLAPDEEQDVPSLCSVSSASESWMPFMGEVDVLDVQVDALDDDCWAEENCVEGSDGDS